VLWEQGSGLDARQLDDGSVVVGWADEPEVPLLGTWRPVVAGYIVKDASGAVTAEQVRGRMGARAGGWLWVQVLMCVLSTGDAVCLRRGRGICRIPVHPFAGKVSRAWPLVSLLALRQSAQLCPLPAAAPRPRTRARPAQGFVRGKTAEPGSGGALAPLRRASDTSTSASQREPAASGRHGSVSGSVPGNKDLEEEGSVFTESTGLGGVALPTQAPFVVQLHPGTMRHQFEFFGWVERPPPDPRSRTRPLTLDDWVAFCHRGGPRCMHVWRCVRAQACVMLGGIGAGSCPRAYPVTHTRV
jgi:hypothetical protein